MSDIAVGVVRRFLVDNQLPAALARNPTQAELDRLLTAIQPPEIEEDEE